VTHSYKPLDDDQCVATGIDRLLITVFEEMYAAAVKKTKKVTLL